MCGFLLGGYCKPSVTCPIWGGWRKLREAISADVAIRPSRGSTGLHRALAEGPCSHGWGASSTSPSARALARWPAAPPPAASSPPNSSFSKPLPYYPAIGERSPWRSCGWGLRGPEYLSRWDTRLVTSDRSPGLLLSLLLQCCGQSWRRAQWVPQDGCPVPSKDVLEPSQVWGAQHQWPCGPGSAARLRGQQDSHGLARTPGWLRRGPAALAPPRSGRPDCRTSWGGRMSWAQSWTHGTGNPATEGRKETHLLAAS